MLVGRILLALMFVIAGFGKIGGFDGTAGYIASKGLPLPQLGAAIAIVRRAGRRHPAARRLEGALGGAGASPCSWSRP